MNWDIEKKYLLYFLASILLIISLIFPLQDSDTFFYLSLGRSFFQTFQFAAEDPYLFSFKKWHIYHEWLSYIVFYFTYYLGGYAGLILFKIILWVTAFTLFVQRSQKWNISQVLTTLLLILTFTACSFRFVERASLFSDLLILFLTLLLIDSSENLRKKYYVILPLLFLVWVNLHPAYVIGLSLLGIYAIRVRKKYLFLSLALCGFATLFNPEFLQGAFYPIQTVFNQDWHLYRLLNYEWMPTFQQPFLSTYEVKILIVLFAVTFLLLSRAILNNWKENIISFSFFLIFSYLAFNASRFITTSALGFCAISLFCLGKNKFELPPKIETIGKIALCVLLPVVSIYILMNGYDSSSAFRKIGTGINEKVFPVKAVDYIKKNNLKGHIFNEYEWGSYLTWSLDQKDQLFIHGHIDDPKLMAYEYHAVNTTLEKFNSIIAKYKIDYFLLDKSKLSIQPQPPILEYLKNLDLIYQDDVAALFAVKSKS